MIIWAIVVAGGSGSRFGGPKHRQTLDGVELWQRSVDVLRDAGVVDVVVVGDVPGGIPGGARRRDSVAAGLGMLPERVDWVLIQDAARPLVSTALVDRVLSRARIGDVDAVIPVLPVTDTLKRVHDQTVLSTIDRSDLVSVQTPEAFSVPFLRAAHDADASDATDDAVLVERASGSVATVEGDPMNLKITTQRDLVIAHAYLNSDSVDG